MFLTEDDYRVVCDEDELDILTRSEPETRQKAERVAMEEVASYLRPRYDTEKAFAAEGDQRNAMLVQVTVNNRPVLPRALAPAELGSRRTAGALRQRDRMAYPREQRRFNAESTDVHRRGRGNRYLEPDTLRRHVRQQIRLLNSG